MNINYYPEELKEILDGMICEVNTIGCSNAGVYKYYNSENSYYLKVQPVQQELKREYEIMKWLQNKLPVPEILYFCSQRGFDYLLMTELEGEMTCSGSCLSKQEETVGILAEGIKMLQAVPIENCPFNNGLENKLKDAKIKIENNLVDMSDWEKNNRFGTPLELLDFLQNNKPKVSTHMFTHGDYCLPNIFCRNNRVSGFIDLGRGGIADIYQDIALCVRSLRHNFKKTDNTGLLFEYLQMEPDWERIEYYILLDELF